MIKKHLTFISLIINSLFIFGMENNFSKESWQYLMNAEREFDKKNYSLSMRLAQDAVSKRIEESETNFTILTNAITPYQVRKVGDNINDVLDILKERQEYDAIKIINFYTTKMGYEYFSSSIKKLSEYISNYREYPEAYFLIAKIYHIEGEFDMALTYLEKARANSFLLEIPQNENDILFLMSEIAEYKKDIPMQEKALILIAKNSGDFQKEILKKAIIRTSKSTKDDNSSRFFKLYRVDAVSCVNSYNKLSHIYLDSKKYEDAYLTSAYSVLICFTHLNSLLEERESDYVYSDLKGFFRELARYPDMMKWCNDVNFWESFYNLCDIGLKCGYTRFPKDIIKSLSEFCPENYWKLAASKRLKELNSLSENQ